MPTRHEKDKQAEQHRHQNAWRRNIWIGLGTAIIALFVIVAVMTFANSPAPTATPTAIAQIALGQCDRIQDFPSQGNTHIAPGDTHPAYNSNPPNSGWHWANPQDWGIYDTSQVQEQLAHNLEHGGIVIQYRDLAPADAQRLGDLVRQDRVHIVLAPYPGLPTGANVALTAWTHVQLCNGVNETAIKSFVAAWRDKGPELVP